MPRIKVLNATNISQEVKTDVDVYQLPPKSKKILNGTKLLDAPKGVSILATVESKDSVDIAAKTAKK